MQGEREREREKRGERVTKQQVRICIASNSACTQRPCTGPALCKPMVGVYTNAVVVS